MVRLGSYHELIVVESKRNLPDARQTAESIRNLFELNMLNYSSALFATNQKVLCCFRFGREEESNESL